VKVFGLPHSTHITDEKSQTSTISIELVEIDLLFVKTSADLARCLVIFTFEPVIDVSLA
jgi:hypothetical protein